LVLKSISVFHLPIAIMIAIEKLIRIDRDPIFVRRSVSDFSGKIDLFFYIFITIACENHSQINQIMFFIFSTGS